MLTRDQQRQDLEVGGRLRLAYPRTAFSPCLRKSRKSAQMTSSLKALREPRARPAGFCRNVIERLLEAAPNAPDGLGVGEHVAVPLALSAGRKAGAN